MGPNVLHDRQLKNCSDIEHPLLVVLSTHGDAKLPAVATSALFQSTTALFGWLAI